MKVSEFYSSPEQLQYISTLSHNIPGFVLCIVAILFFLSESDYIKSKVLIYVYTGILVVMPNVFWVYIFASNGITNSMKIIKLMSNFPEVYLHSLTWVGNNFGGIGELFYKGNKIKSPLGFLFFPILFLIDGFLSILHPHGIAGHSDNFHNIYGSIMVLVAIAIIISRTINHKIKIYFTLLASILIIIAGSMLMSYTEPKSSFISAFVEEDASSTNFYYPTENFANIYISEKQAYPLNIELKSGGYINFVKLDDSLVDISLGPYSKHDEYPQLNIGFMRKGQEKKVYFDKLGLHTFHDHVNELNPNYSGKILVIE